MKRLIVTFFAVMAALPAISAGETNATTLSPTELKAYRKLYLGKCAKCHELHSPEAYTSSQWNGWLTKMNRSSKLTPAQAMMIKRYTEMLREKANGKSGQTNLNAP